MEATACQWKETGWQARATDLKGPDEGWNEEEHNKKKAFGSSEPVL